MDAKDITQQAQRIDQAAQRERLSSPEIVQMPGSSRGGGGGEPEIHRAFCAENAPSDSTVIKCYLDSDKTGTTWLESHSYSIGDYVNGTDSEIYRCIKAHTSSTADRPITGEPGWEEFWALEEEIPVHCNIFAGGYLADCFPYLTDGKDILVFKDGDIWYALYWFNGTVECEIEAPA